MMAISAKSMFRGFAPLLGSIMKVLLAFHLYDIVWHTEVSVLFPFVSLIRYLVYYLTKIFYCFDAL